MKIIRDSKEVKIKECNQLKENDMRYSVEELINTVGEKSCRNSEKNNTKLRNCGIKSGERIDFGNNCGVVFTASHSGIYKTFYWGSRVVTKNTVIKRCL